MPARGPRSHRRPLTVWIACAGLSGLLLATPAEIRGTVGSALEWSVFLPVRAVLGWGGRSLFLSQQNRRLERVLTAENVEVSRLRDAGRENETLRRMLGMAARAKVSLVGARVVGRNADWTGEVLLLRAPSGMAPGHAVVTPDGLLGRTGGFSGSDLRVETLWNPRVAVSVVDARSGEQGIVRWDRARPAHVSIEHVPLQADFRTGDAIVTSGMGEVFPKGILVGHVVRGDEDPRTQLKRIWVRPAARRGRAEEVFLVLERPPEGDASALFPFPGTSSPGVPAMPGGTTARP